MFGSQNNTENIIISLYKDSRTVFRLRDIALLTGKTNFQSLNSKLNYYVRTGKILNPRKGIYAKPGYNPEELACRIYFPSYISLGYVLQKSGIIFQYDPGISLISYLSRSIEVNDMHLRFRRIKGEILVNTAGIIQHEGHINIASAERAFLDLMYLDSGYYLDNLHPLDRKAIDRVLPIYNSKSLTSRINDMMKNG